MSGNGVRASLDVRTRHDDDVRDIDAASFFGDELPALAAARSDLAVPGALELSVEPFTIESPVGPFTLAIVDDQLVVDRGDEGTACVRLSHAELADLVNDLKTPMTFLTGGTLQMVRGNLGDFLDWWVVLRALVDGRAAHTRGSIEFVDREGAPLDLDRAFGPDDDDEDLAHFLAQAGFLRLRNWFDAATMREVSADMDRALPTYTPDDGNSWWAKTADGTNRCVRMQCFQAHSPATAALLDSERFLRIGALTRDGHAPRVRDGNRIEALEKPIGVVEGISDVPWHKDCSLGMHSYNCSSMTIGISVTGAGERSGQLRVVAGSHRALVQPSFYRPEWGLPIVDLPTETGDVTVHCSCTLHMAQPPVERERRVMYTGFTLPARRAGEVRTAAMTDISRVREGAYKTVSQAPGHVG